MKFQIEVMKQNYFDIKQTHDFLIKMDKMVENQ